MADTESTSTEEERLRQQAQQRLERRRRKMQSPEERLALITGRPLQADTNTSPLPVTVEAVEAVGTVGTMTAEDPPLETLTRDIRPEGRLRPGSSSAETDLLSSLLVSGGEVSADTKPGETQSQLASLVWVMLALVVRITLETEYSFVIGHNIFLPFALSLSVMMSLGYINLSLNTSTGSTILSAGRYLLCPWLYNILPNSCF